LPSLIVQRSVVRSSRQASYSVCLKFEMRAAEVVGV
jgi:hypothetical protein